AAEGLAYLRRLIDETDPHNKIGLCVLEENGFRHDMQRALGHARMILAFERSGLVEIDYAANCLQPWQQHDNYWDQGQVFFTPSQVWGMPPFYAQQMLARHYQPLLVETQVEGSAESLEVTAARSEDGLALVLKVVNGSGEDCITRISTQPGAVPYAKLICTCLSGGLADRNTPEDPARVVPVETDQPGKAEDVDWTFPAHSFTILEFRA
ncbi:MAG: alpha-L-arabinofuranosidase, partial [Chloroflexi bacterium]